MEFKIILILLFVHYLQLYIVKPKHNKLYCGIYAWAGKDIKQFNADKFNILGLFNIERGKDSCGISYDGEIYTGIGKDKLYSDFILERDIQLTKYPTIIGHTRQASYGNIVNEHNAHPFGFGENNNGYEFIGCHNGTLYNDDVLAKRYNVETREEKITVNAHGTKTYEYRSKIDSEILLEIIYSSKSFDVLAEYNGGAALVFSNTNEPNVIYVWKGASKEFNYVSQPVKEERPLCYYKESKNSLYISSLANSLLAIGGKLNKTVFTFDENTVYKITDGDISKAVKIKVDREGATQKKEVPTTTYGHTSSTRTRSKDYYDSFDHRAYDDCWEWDSDLGDYKLITPAPKTIIPNPNIIGNTNNKVISTVRVPNIYTELLLHNQNEYGGKTYFNKLRFWKNGHLLSGIYTFVKGYGYYRLDEYNVEAANTALINLVGVPFIDKYFNFSLTKKGIDISHPEIQKTIPFKTLDDCNFNIHYFIQGVKIENGLDFKVTYNQYQNSIKANKLIDYIVLSEISTHPIIDLENTVKNVDYQGITFRSKLVTDTISPLGSEKRYVIESGNLKKLYVSDYGKKLLWVDEKFKTKDEALDFIKDEKQTSLFDNLEDLIDNVDLNTELSQLNELFNEEITEKYCEISDLIDLLKENTEESPEIDEKIKKLEVIKDYLTSLM